MYLGQKVDTIKISSIEKAKKNENIDLITYLLPEYVVVDSSSIPLIPEKFKMHSCICVCLDVKW